MGLLEGKFAVITGAASARGLGKATARLFAEHGATVSILDLDAAAAQAAAADLGAGHVGLACDVTDPDACKAVAADLEGRWGRIDVLVNNAGITQPLRLMDIAPGNYEAVLDVNLRGTLYMSQAVIPGMRARGAGGIVNMSSVSAQRGGGIFGGPHYSAAKAGVLGLTKAMARELAPDGVRVNAICPGFIDTDITAGKLTAEMRAQVLAGIPMGRAGEASDVAGCALFLASDLSSYCTGTEVDVNGGSLIH
ncbi:SDR family NAD(P)-dependent oxidoreductase [Rubrimonas cliftonensis]|uniref:NAD(P)-dependent dehydrogenase, short-chain alcohol dehydrogenase family n=1 Tax=Rubrimonas cliftonensis TaxID=89524 RepID=A0A1H4D7U0_9RHOB|nr:SDR family oxidoreductase [Rubrimonas cliftonensis]SEA68761.1 NAD(P)-dependent dehydrogenase, short-chain alcohol dehydrogenase family [Rubrimonas cliftonensis]